MWVCEIVLMNIRTIAIPARLQNGAEYQILRGESPERGGFAKAPLFGVSFAYFSDVRKVCPDKGAS